jgi:hypothetical protein
MLSGTLVIKGMPPQVAHEADSLDIRRPAATHRTGNSR